MWKERRIECKDAVIEGESLAEMARDGSWTIVVHIASENYQVRTKIEEKTYEMIENGTHNHCHYTFYYTI